MIENTVLNLKNLEIAEKIYQRYVEGNGFKYGWKSNGQNENDQGHWNKRIFNNSKVLPCDLSRTPLMERHQALNQVFEMIKDVIGDRGLYRAYINGYTYGTDGYPHKDDTHLRKTFGENSLSETAVMFLNHEWDFTYGGETAIFTEDKEIEMSVLPKFGRILIFDSSKWHAARPLSRVCKDLRLILAVKTIDRNIVSKEVNYIVEHFKNVKHSNRWFFDHLFGTMLICERRVEDIDIIKAALYHSVYGTAYFKLENQFNDIPSRNEVRDLIGDKAENLVYEFCNLEDRANSLLRNTKGYDTETLVSLLEIEVSNSIELNFSGRNTNKIQVLEAKLKEYYDRD